MYKQIFKVVADWREAKRKKEVLARVPEAFQRQVNKWAAETIVAIKERLRSGEFFKREPKEIAQRLDYRVKKIGEREAEVILGTGKVIGRREVVYAAIQEFGGVIRPVKKKALTIPFKGVRHSAPMYMPEGSFIKRGDDGRAYIVKAGKRKLKYLFLLSRRVELPARRWWSKSVGKRVKEIDKYINEDILWERAKKLAGSK